MTDSTAKGQCKTVIYSSVTSFITACVADMILKNLSILQALLVMCMSRVVPGMLILCVF